MDYNTIQNVINSIHRELAHYGATIKEYRVRVNTWKDPNTCEKYFRSMNDNEDFIDKAIAYLKSNNIPFNKNIITTYEYYQNLRAEVIG